MKSDDVKRLTTVADVNKAAVLYSRTRRDADNAAFADSIFQSVDVHVAAAAGILNLLTSIKMADIDDLRPSKLPSPIDAAAYAIVSMGIRIGLALHDIVEERTTRPTEHEAVQ